MKKKLALYIHIPFCVKKCLYCDFLSATANEQEKESYVQALFYEMDHWKDYLQQEYQIQSIFIGGGTPTALPVGLLERICQKLQTDFLLEQAENLEFTIEANPGTVTKEYVEMFQRVGINRVSLGLQSAQSKELKALGRIHTYQDLLDSVALLQEYGISNINIDLMEDIPYQTLESYKDTLEKVCTLPITHISSYSLIIEPGTPFYEMEQKGELLIANEDEDRKMYELTKEVLKEHGYERYEISNYAKKGMECRHNITYWNLGEYLGLGLGAASYLGGFRFENERDFATYQEIQKKRKLQSEERITVSKVPCDVTKEYLWGYQEIHRESCQDEMEEFMFLGLRMCCGVSRKAFYKRFGIELQEIYQDALNRLFRQKLLAEDKNHDRIYLTDLGIDISNTVLAEFLL